MGISSRCICDTMAELEMNTKVSVICTLKNEATSISSFIESLLSQSRVPDEIILVDGGSKDNSQEIIKSYIKKGAPIHLVVKDGINIAEGRNLAIKYAKYDLIASTDLGCILDSDWLKNLIEPFEKCSETDVVCGWYKPESNNTFEKCLADVTYPKLENVLKDPTKFLPSSRSVAYKKKCWKDAGGYPEWLYTAEDTTFDLNLKKMGCKFVFAPNAFVYWKTRPNIKSALKQYYLYGIGDGQSRLFFKSYLLAYLRYFTGLFLVIASLSNFYFFIVLMILVALYYIMVIRYRSINWKENLGNKLLILSLVDLAAIIGFSRGLVLKTKN